MIERMPDRLHFTESDEANALIASDPMALLIGFALDQQVSVQKAFAGPLAIRERVGTLDPAVLAETDLDPVFRERPAVHRFPGSMAQRVQDLAAYIRDNYDGDAGRVWTDAADSAELRANLSALPWLRRDEDQGARRGAGQALRGAGGTGPRAAGIRRSGTSTPPRRCRVPDGQARSQGRVDEDEGRRAFEAG